MIGILNNKAFYSFMVNNILYANTVHAQKYYVHQIIS